MRRSPLKLNLSFVNTLKKWHPFCAQEMSKNPVFIGFPFLIPSVFFFFNKEGSFWGRGWGFAMDLNQWTAQYCPFWLYGPKCGSLGFARESKAQSPLPRHVSVLRPKVFTICFACTTVFSCGHCPRRRRVGQRPRCAR